MAKIQRQIKRQEKTVISPVMIAAVAIASLLLVGGLIYLGNLGQSEVDLDQFPALGAPNAPVTLIEYSDYG